MLGVRANSWALCRLRAVPFCVDSDILHKAVGEAVVDSELVRGTVGQLGSALGLALQSCLPFDFELGGYEALLFIGVL